jgi:Na+/H+ antiporter NhaC
MGFLPIILFVLLYVGSGIYFSILGMNNAFYKISPNFIIIPCIALGFILKKKNAMSEFIDGMRHKDIITMCCIFLLSGVFGEVTKSVGCVDSVVNLSLSCINHKYILIGLFITSAFISTSIGTSMGTISSVAPIAVALSNKGAFDMAIGVATVVGGAMFGDNLSLVSDTTIAAVSSQEADMKEKLKLNSKIAFVSAIFTCIALLFFSSSAGDIKIENYNIVMILPYIILVFLAGVGYDVFIALLSGILSAFVIGLIFKDYGIIKLNNDFVNGFKGMHEITILSLLIGGLSALSKDSVIFV